MGVYLKAVWFEAILIFIVFLYIPIVQVFTNEDTTSHNSGFSIKQSNADPTTDKNTIVVEVAGAVLVPGVYRLSEGSRIKDLLEISEGYIENADIFWVTKNLNSARILKDSEKLYIPFQWERYDKLALINTNVPFTSAVLNSTTGTSDSSSEDSIIHINTASKEQLMSIPGIGDVYSSKIIKNLPYEDLEDFRNRSLLSPKLIDKIADHITF